MVWFNDTNYKARNCYGGGKMIWIWQWRATGTPIPSLCSVVKAFRREKHNYLRVLGKQWHQGTAKFLLESEGEGNILEEVKVMRDFNDDSKF